MQTWKRIIVAVLSAAVLLSACGDTSWARGGFRGGGGRGGGGRGGGGGYRGGGARPSWPASRPSRPPVNRSPSFSGNRPTQRPNVNRPSQPVNRPAQRPSTPGVDRPGTSRPNTDRPTTRPSNPNLELGNRPGVVEFPSRDRPSVADRPSTRPGIADRPGAGDRPGIADRPATGDRPGISDRPGIADRPATLPGLGNHPNRPGAHGIGDRGDRFENRQDWMNDRVANRGDRQDNLQDRLDNRNENWQDWRDDRWDHRDDVREDWQDWADHHWDDHDHWHHGYWHDNWGGWWDHMWDEHPGLMALGISGWGINRMNYWFGYWGYYNPYYVEPYYVAPEVVIDYSQPLTVYEQAAYTDSAPAESPATPGAPAATDPATQAFDQARQAFYTGSYDEALASVNTALSTRPDDAVLHEFRALVMFATGKYTDAAAGLHAVLAVGPGWDWTTLSSLYASVDTYTEQLRALEDYARQNDPAPAARFVLAYHYLTCGHTEQAAEQLRKVLEAQPKDEVAAQMLQMSSAPTDDASATSPTPSTAAESSVTIPKADLVGTWTAEGQGGAKFTLALKEDGQFEWTYSAAAKDTKAEGVFALDGDNLALEPDAGGTMLAQITPPANGKFHFQEVGGPDGDTGLDFQK